MSTHKNRTVMAEINMVPFIDITLILLIIFMVMSPMLVQMQLTVDLPKSKAINTQAEDDVIPILVQADKDVPIQQVVDVFDVAKKLGAAKLGIGVLSKN